MNIQEYLKQCSVKSVDELTDEQVVSYYTNGNAGIAQECAVELALQDYPKCGFTIEQIIRVSSSVFQFLVSKTM